MARDGGVYNSKDPAFERAHNYALDQESKVSGVITRDIREERYNTTTGRGIVMMLLPIIQIRLTNLHMPMLGIIQLM